MSKELDLATLEGLLQAVRRHPQSRAARVKAAEAVATLAEHESPGNRDNLLSDAVRVAKLLRRALARANKGDLASTNDVAAMNAWIDSIHPLLLKIIERPVQG